MDGSITNHLQVRHALRFQQWHCNSDRETLAEGLAQRGLALLLDLRGMFAFVAYDSTKQQLFLGRDPLGLKPLFLVWRDDGLCFGSSLPSFPSANPLAHQALVQLLAFGHHPTPPSFPGPETKGIVSLPAGMVARINHSRPHNPVRYWPPQPRPDWTPLPIHSSRRAATFLRQLLEEVVHQHLRMAGPLPCFLQGDRESALLASMACNLQPESAHTIAVALPGTPQASLDWAQSIAAACGSQHHSIRIDSAQALKWVEEGLPLMQSLHPEAISSFLSSRALSGHGITSVFSSIGADALFGGTPAHRLMPWLWCLRLLPAPVRIPLLQAFAPCLSARLSALPGWDRWHLGLALRRLASDADLAAAGCEPLQWPEPPPHRITQAWGQTSWVELFGTTEPWHVRDGEALAEACGLELRLPFLDHRIVELALRMPQRFQKRGNGLLLQSCADLLPSRFLKVSSLRASLPMQDWMRGPLRELCRSRLEVLQGSGWLHPSWIEGQWQAYEAGSLSWQKAWGLVVLGQMAAREMP